MTALSAQSSSGERQDSISLAISYGAQAMDHLEVMERLLANQKAQVVELGLAHEQSRVQVELLTKKVATVERPGFWRTLWKWTQIAGLAVISFVAGQMVP